MNMNVPRHTWGDWLKDNALDQLISDQSLGVETLSLEWKPVQADVDAAWPFLIELRSRIATRPLEPRSGDEHAALASIYQLFPIFRRLAKRNPGCVHFTTLTLALLDRYLRPFTSRWHRQSLAGLLASMDVSVEFRLELSALQEKLRDALKLYSLLAGVDPASVSCDLQQPPTIFSEPLELVPKSSDSNLEAVFASERQAIKRRRMLAPKVLSVPGDPNCNGVGLALSGGGIRSATFSLGIVTQLAHRGILDQVDYLSTVSGGGYLGAFVTTLMGKTATHESSAAIFGSIGAGDTPAIRVLRNHSRYLIEGGVWTILSFMGLMLSGVMASILMIIPVIAALAIVIGQLQGLRSLIDTYLATTTIAVLITGFGLVLLAQRFQTAAERNVILSWMVALLLILYGWLGSRPWFTWVTNVDARMLILLVAGISIMVIALLKLPNASKAVLGLMVWFAGPLLLFVAATAIETAWNPSFGQLASTCLIGLAVTFLINLNVASPHRFYRDRIARTYILQADATGAPTSTSLSLTELNQSERAPYHLINAALNIPGSKSPENRGRGADFFLFSKDWCGSRTTGYFKTSEWQKTNTQLSLASAIAISGAAAAPNMGTNAASRYRQILSMLNVRLNVWLKRPDRSAPFWAWLYFWREMLGSMTEASAYVNLSDGGHIENLAVYELLRRQCKFIIAVDGEADPLRQFGALVTLTQLAYIDLGVRIDPDLCNLRVDANGIGQSHFEMFRIQYPGEKLGLLLYVKASLTGNESEFLRSYRNDHPDFPHESTAKQLYSEQQFEAYRSLGEHIARDLFRKELAGKNAHTGMSVQTWFEHLARHLLKPTN
jgi:hypothetical protein